MNSIFKKVLGKNGLISNGFDLVTVPKQISEQKNIVAKREEELTQAQSAHLHAAAELKAVEMDTIEERYIEQSCKDQMAAMMDGTVLWNEVQWSDLSGKFERAKVRSAEYTHQYNQLATIATAHQETVMAKQKELDEAKEKLKDLEEKLARKKDQLHNHLAM